MSSTSCIEWPILLDVNLLAAPLVSLAFVADVALCASAA